MRKKWDIRIGTALMSCLLLAACGTNEDANTEENNTNTTVEEENNTSANEEANTNANSGADEAEMVHIGASQIVEHPSLDAAYEGFKEGLADNGFVEGEQVTFDLQSAQGDPNNAATIANNFVADDVDLIFANSTPSAQGALQASEEIPIIFTSVTDAVGAGLIESMDQPGENITGVLDLHPESIEKTVSFIDEYFADSTVGLIYNSGEQNSVAQIEAVEAAVEGTTLEALTRSVSTSAEVQQAADSLIGEADVLFIITDNTVVSALETIVATANDYDIPLIVGEPDSLERGGFATFGIDYHSIGYRTGEMAAEVLSGEKTTADIPTEYPADMQLFINQEAADAQAIEWHADWDDQAELME
ncbi:BMP family ABC transporter substrate-binding protein [Salipaludibacillus neizhouensis]|uniref:BMP family ABC transporter substrate-binding protein n=1 Tax=Salipaludibacillus neizhouensis TaxID=885475 RepID=A0A3A9KEY9_9BACI|nr:ABC transporter substrate-binding protein [Salipaludibacillus neizhouensis]RKL68213.1 BMP family ABC transporter substrate-binding protein [Salipaludibacillus neizhouensis]